MQVMMPYICADEWRAEPTREISEVTTVYVQIQRF